MNLPKRIRITTNGDDAKLPCPECKDKGYVDLLQGREPCKLCTAVDFAKGGIISGTVFHLLLPRVNPEKRLGSLKEGEGRAFEVIENDHGFRKDPLPTAVLVEVAREMVRRAAKEALMVEAEEETCDECYGSGYWHGIGAPCSKGCKPKD